MTLEIYQDRQTDPPDRVRRVSFATSAATRAPLTPHSKNNVRSTTPTKRRTENSVHKTKTQTSITTMDDKENQQSGVTSLRRQLRATMSPPPPTSNNKENGTSQPFKKANAATNSNNTKTALTPSLRHNTKRGKSSRLVKTPKSLLKRELAFNDTEESLLISPGAAASFSLADDSPVEAENKQSQLRSPFETVQEVESEEGGSHEKQEKSVVPLDTKDEANEGILANDDIKQTSKQEAVATKPQVATGKAQQRAFLRQQRSLNTVLTESKKVTGTTPYRARGNGVQMDLSSMFSEIASPEANVKSSRLLSPARETTTESTESIPVNVPVASLDNLRESLWLDFGDERSNQVGTTRMLSFIIEGPTESSSIAEVERVPFKKGFNLVVDEDATVETKASISSSDENKPTSIRLRAGERVLIKVSWTPVESGGVREVIYLKLPRGRLCVIVHGKARSPPKGKSGATRKKKSLQQLFATESSGETVVSKMNRVQSTPATNMSQHATVFAKSSPGSSVTNAAQAAPAQAKNNDENWADKQCEAFANWMNYTFQPSEDKDHEASLLDESGNGMEVRDRAALRTLILHRRMAQVRTRAMDLFTGDKMQMAQRAIHVEVSKRRLKLRVDRDMYADLTLRGQIISLLLSYTTPWLRLGLETIFGETILPESPNHFSPQKPGLAALTRKADKVPLSRMKLTLKGFIVNRVLSDPATLNKYTNGRCKVPSGNFETKFKAEMRFLTLRRLLTLIVFLDRAKVANVLDRVPMLFSKTSKVKSSRDVLVRLCRDFLSSEGDIIKHLSRIGITVSYKQTAIDEVDYTVENLAIDLRDGVRLARATEILTCEEPKSILVKLRLPAVSRLQKLHNVGSVITILREKGVPGLEDVAPHHIVDAHKEMVLKLMWSILAYCGLRTILNAQAIEQEIQSVLRANSSRRPHWKLGLDTTVPSDNVVIQDASVGQEAYYKTLLLRWVNAICSCFGRTASDFASSFADGTVLCLVIHYYHPGHLPLDQILPTTRHLRTDDADMRAQALLRETRNFELAQATISELGGIPKMITTANSDCPPEENSMFLSVAYLCSRLMESSREILACIRIQSCYCRYKRRVELEKKLAAASIILDTWRGKKRQYYANQERIYEKSVRIIENFLLSVKDQLYEMRRQRLRKEAKACAATLIQAHVRRMISEQTILPVLVRNRAALKIQSAWRRYDAKIELEMRFIEQESAIAIQKIWRGFHKRSLFSYQVDSITIIQAIFRGYCARSKFVRCFEAAIAVQRVWRGFWAQLQTQLDYLDIITVQSIVRRRLAILERERRRHGILVLQRNIRRVLAIQAVKRMKYEHRLVVQREAAALTCQAVTRRYLAMQMFQRTRRDNVAATIIQTRWRSAKSLHHYRVMKASATLLQALARGVIIRDAILMQTSSATVIQRTWRCFLARAYYEVEVHSIILIQKVIRGWNVRIQLVFQRSAATAIQSVWRSYSASKLFRSKLDLVVSLQSIYRGLQVRRELQFVGACACVIQATWRRYWAELQYQVDLVDIILVQSMIRRRAALVKYSWSKSAVLVLQSFLRMCVARNKVAFLRRNNAERKQQHEASVCLQSVARCYLARQSRKRQVDAIVLCQSIARRHLVQKQTKVEAASAVIIQRTWRCFMAFVEYTLVRSDIILVQALSRRRTAIKSHKNRMASVICLQNVARIWLARRRVESLRRARVKRLRQKAARQMTSATSIQALFRGHVLRCELQRLNNHATVIQSRFRTYLARLDYEMHLIDIILVQSVVRGWCARITYARCLQSVLQIQTFARVCQAKQKMERIRSVRDQKYREEKAAEMIQKTWRCYTIHVDFMILILSTLTIQALIRRHRAVVKCRKLRLGIVHLQALARGVAQRNFQRHLGACAVDIQSRVRAFLAQYNFRRTVAAVVSIQSLSRGFLARVDIDLQQFAACEIQKIWRGYQQNVDYLLQLIAVIKIQSTFRSVLARDEVEAIRQVRFLETIEDRFREKKAVSIQRSFRTYRRLKFAAKAASTIQACVRGFQCRQQVGAMIDGIILFQGIWRGRVTRRRRQKKVRIIAKRLTEANVRALQDPSMCLGARTASALLVLQNSTRLVEIMDAVKTLETSTRLSRNCCIAFTECDAPEIVYSLVRTCNRSLPHVELLHFVLLTLTNIASHEELLSRVSTEESVEVYMDLVQMFRDKDNVFCLAVALLYKAIAKNRDLKDICSSSENVKRLKGVHSLCVRKLSVTNTTRVTRSTTRSADGTKRKSKGTSVVIDRKQGVHMLQKIIRVLEN